jgi:hypothetical protein
MRVTVTFSKGNEISPKGKNNMKRLLLPIFYLLILLPSTALGSSIHIPQTGQTTVYASADDGDTKTGTAWPSPRFTDNGNGTVADTMTGLTWAKDANIIKNRDPGFDADGTGGDGIVSWQHALDYVKKLNAESYLGYNDWRLPNLNELASLLNEGQSSGSAWLTAQSFLNPQSTFYWSSTTTSSSLGQAWAVSIDGGMVGHLDKSLFGSVWPVRGGNNASFLPQTGQVDCYDVQGAAIPCAGTGQDGELQRGLSWPDPRFTENGDGTVTDNLTGLVWSLDAKPLVGAANVDDPAVSWQGALDQVQTMNKEAYLGFTDWRLPNRNELASLINYSDSTLTWLTRQGILNPQNDYWSSSTFTPSPDRAWNIGMNGEIFSKVKAGNDNSYRGSFVWPVRGGRTFALTISKTGSASGTVEADIGAIVWSQSSGTLFCPPGTRISLSAAPDAGAIFAGWGGPCNGVQACTISMDADQSVTATFSLGGLTTGVNTKALVAMQPAASGLSITTTSLTAGTADAAYSKSLAASGGKTPYTWSITSGTLPAGLSLSSAGVISGTPTTAGSSSFTVQVKDASNTTATKSLSLTINPAPLAVSTVSLPSAAVGVSYNQSLAASGGTPPYTWSRTTGTLPSGITLSTSGVLSGAPTTSGTSTFTVQVKDSKSTTATKSLSLTVAVPLQINNSVLSNGYVGAVYSDTVSASGGKTPYSWALAGGSLPSGLAIDAGTGTVSGTPTTAGTYNSTVQVKDANNTVVTNPLTIVILPAVSVSTSSLPADYVGVSYSQTLMAAGGVAPYTWSIVAGSLPAGLALASDTGLISGTPTAAGTTSFSVQVKDAINAVATKTISMTVSGLGSIAGVVTDAATGAPLAGVTVTLSLTGITSPNSTDLQYSCNSTPLAAGDYSTVSLNDGSKFGCTSSGKYNTMTFKAKNPFGMDPFTVSWNGISALNRVDYVAQSFKPTADGSLNKVSFYLPYGKDQGRTGQVWVQLKSALGGDAGSQIAESNSVGIDFLPTGTPTWVDFVFPTPAMLTAGQQYYLEIQGNVWNGPALDALYWGNYASYANGSSYQRAGGVWSQLSNSLSFQTFVNSQPDLVVTGPTSSYTLTMAGGAVQEANLYVYDQINGWNLPGGTVDSSIGHLIYTSDGFEYNGDDLTINWTVGDKLANYYDPNGWVILTVNNYSRLWSSPPVTTLVTDRFKVSFNRTLTAVTDANGAYSFASLPGGDYNLAFDKSPYTAQSMTGALAPGQGLNVPASLAMPAPASLQGTVTSNGVAIAGVRVTVTDASGTKRAVTGNDGSYLVGHRQRRLHGELRGSRL